MSVVIVDVHEPDWLKELADEVRSLDAGDIVVEGKKKTYVVERKTVNDLVGTVENKRFFAQLHKLRGSKGVPLLVIEGNHFAVMKVGRLIEPVWLGLQVSVAERGVGMVRTWSEKETGILLGVLRRRADKEGHTYEIKAVKRYESETDEVVNVIGALRGVGEKKALKLLKRFGSVKGVVNASESELVSVLGEKVGKHVYEIVNKEVKVDG